ncbi:MAG: macro domain-containing protein [Magnetococcales bacterium]|nr:macro domain-containing protein [Nitrospirota bacterium]
MEIISEKSIGNKTLRLVKGDITERDVDTIVNAANSHLQHGGGVAAAIVKKGGNIIQEQSNKIGYVPVGRAAVTRAGTLPCKAVIHAVGPRMGEGQEDEKLASAAVSSLKLASEHGFESISMPAVSSGIFGFPKDRCAAILVRQSRLFLEQNTQSTLKTVEFCIYDDNTLAYFKSEFERL